MPHPYDVGKIWNQDGELIHYTLTEYTAPTVEPVTVSGVQTHCRVTIGTDNSYFTDLISVARRQCEMFCNRSFVNTTWDMYLDKFPHVIRPPRSPLVSATITYTDTDEVTQTLSTDEYTVDTASIPGRIYESYDGDWPDVLSISNAVKVRFIAGYGASAAWVPIDLRHAVKILVGHYYENREQMAQAGQDMTPMPFGLKDLLRNYKIKTVM